MRPSRDPAPRALRWGGLVLAWVVILGLVAALVVGVLLPRAVGGHPYTILTGSMRPSYPPGTLVVVRPTPAQEIGVGDVVTYQLRSGSPTVVTHRVVQVGISTVDGDYSYTTQGDANPAVDTQPVQAVQLRGELWYAVPYLGYASTWISGRNRQVIVYLVAGALALYAVALWVGALRDRAARRDEELEGVDERA